MATTESRRQGAPGPAAQPRVWRDRLVLVVLCVVPAALEAWLARPLGAGSQALAAQVGAPAPFGVFHDLRWLVVFARSWPQFAASLAVLLIVRSVLTATQVRASWPADLPPPPAGRLLRTATVSTAVSLLLFAPLAGIQFGMAVASISYLFLGAVPAAFVLAVLLHPSVLRPWWRAVPTLRSTGWILASGGWLMLAGAAVVLSPAWARIPVVSAAGAVDAWLWVRLVGALSTGRVRSFALAPIGVVALAGAVFGMVTLSVGGTSQAGPTGAGPRPTGAGIPVLYVSGFADGWYGRASLRLGSGFPVTRFSYAGIRPDGAPRYYPYTDTYEPMPHLVALLRSQVAELHRRTGRRVDVVAESAGGMIAKAYLMATPHAPVRALLVASPLVDPVSVYFPGPGRSGYGLVGEWLMAADSAVLRTVTPLNLPVTTPLFRSAETHAPALDRMLDCPLPGVRQGLLSPLADAVSTSYRGTGSLQVDDVAAFHGGVLTMPSLRGEIRSFLTTGRLQPDRSLGDLAGVIQTLSQAWDVPRLGSGLNPAWSRLDGAYRSCARAHRDLRAWLG